MAGATFTIQGDAILENAIARFRRNEEGADQDIARRVREIVEEHGYVRVSQEERREITKEVSKDILTGYGITAVFSIAISGLYHYLAGYMHGKSSVLDALPLESGSAVKKTQLQDGLDMLITYT